MKRILFALAVLVFTGLALLPQVRSQGQPQPGKGLPFGPGDGGATLRQPWLETNPPPAGARPTPSFVQDLLQKNGTSNAGPPPTQASGSLLPYDNTGVNNDILVTSETGPWMILITSYAGKDGPLRARKMVTVLRSDYKLPAYVFNYGAEEKRKELERVKALIDKQKEVLKQSNLPIDQPIRVRYLKVDEHCGVLVGGYPSMEAASKARDQLRATHGRTEPDRNVFKLNEPGDLLDCKFYTPDENSKGARDPELVFVNPFMHAFVVHNPTSKVERPADAGKFDIAALKRMNADEAYSLLKTKKKFTLAIKQFHLPSVTVPRNEPAPSHFLEGFGIGKKAADNIDYAAENAHRLADSLRKSKLEAFVLHTKYYSLVTIGDFESVDHPDLRAMQNVIDTRLIPSMESLELFPKAMPMPIPR